jgi:hypothetical protein
MMSLQQGADLESHQDQYRVLTDRDLDDYLELIPDMVLPRFYKYEELKLGCPITVCFPEGRDRLIFTFQEFGVCVTAWRTNLTYGSTQAEYDQASGEFSFVPNGTDGQKRAVFIGDQEEGKIHGKFRAFGCEIEVNGSMDPEYINREKLKADITIFRPSDVGN